MVLLATVILSGLVFWYIHKNKMGIDCQGRVVWEINNETFKGDVAYQMQNHQGTVTITGDLYTADKKHFKISRIIYFTYRQVRDNFIINTRNLVRFPTDELEKKEGYRAMPPIYLSDNASFSLLIKRYQEGWAFTTVGSPSLLCRKGD